MTGRWLRERIGRFGTHGRGAVREWSGAGDYERYLERCRQGAVAPLDRGRYWAVRLEERYRSTSRCC